jgi:hypothetical protein
MGEQIGLTEIGPAKILGEYKDQYLMIGQASFYLATMMDPTALTLKQYNVAYFNKSTLKIDAQGLWSVDWMRPEGKADDDDSKLPAIEGRTVYLSQSNGKEVLIGAFTKYGALGFRKWAMTKFTF